MCVNVLFSFVVLSNKKIVIQFCKKYPFSQKTCFKVKLLKKFKISNDCHIKICRSLTWRPILKILSSGVARNFLEGGSKSSKMLATMVERRRGFWNAERLSGIFRTLSNEISRNQACLFLAAGLFYIP